MLKRIHSVCCFPLLLFAAALGLVVSSRPTTAAPPVYATPEEATADPDFAVQGEYAGPLRGMQVIARGGGEFELVLYEGGLPGKGWDKTPPQRIDGDAETVAELVESLRLKKVTRSSPTLGAAPPPGAVVLFDGSPKSLEDHWKPGAKRTDNGLLQQGATSVDTFDDYTLHLEFRTPFMPEASGQGRGNSGVYHQGRFETQILDSFGHKGAHNEAGGIYTVRDPDLNMCFPPLHWQTYDVDFTAARYDKQGEKLADARLTVRLNGVVVQSNTPVSSETTAAPVKAGPGPGPIYLQDHGNPVRFRNIWVLPRDADREARRPRVPAFERFSATAGGDSIDGGHVLLANLACTACHQGDTTAPNKQGPVLTDVASRVRPDHLVAMIADPHQAKPGTTMPDPWSGLDPETRQANARAIASFLSLGRPSVVDRVGDASSVQRGEALYRNIGCLACHDAPSAAAIPKATSVPLGNLEKKYTLDSLTGFLTDPHATRPGARMPKLAADRGEARDLACYLLRDVVLVPGQEQFMRTLYKGDWQQLPDFSELEPVDEGPTVGLGFGGIAPLDRFAAVYESYLPIINEGEYAFHLGSDDGSRVLVDDKPVVTHDGIHPYSVKTGTLRLTAGTHRLRVEYFEQAGEEQLTLEIEGPDYARTDVTALVSSDPEGNVERTLVPSEFQPRAALVERGRELFRATGCASCHTFEGNGSAVSSLVQAPPLSRLKNKGGCLADSVAPGLPDYELTGWQRTAILAAFQEPDQPFEPETRIHRTMAAMNCYACHDRNGIGGPEPTRDPVFSSTTPEMGNEGRLPPPLTGVGDKLREEYLATILQQGANERPYMNTRMPAFAHQEMVSLQKDFTAVDRLDKASIPEINEPAHRLKASGRALMADSGLACIKCHTFGGQGTEGIQAIDALRMTERLRKDWFHRYMRDPQAYRPGTRMPDSFVDGKSVLETIYDGDPGWQIESMWRYLSDGSNAKPPVGLTPGAIVLEPKERPIIYRNFISGLSPRGIAVGFPEGCNLAWDAERMALALVWQNQFIDAAKHWQGRGSGAQSPLGDAAIELESQCAVAAIGSADEPWPNDVAATGDYAFLGYRLNPAGQPTFRYRFDGIVVEDAPRPVAAESGPGSFRRELSVQSDEKKPAGLWFRAACGAIVPESDDLFLVDDKYRVKVSGAGRPQLVTIDGTQELRYALPEQPRVTIVQQIRW